MAEEKVLKPKTFRIDEETAEKIRKIAETIGGNQQEAFAKLIEAYEFQLSKAILAEEKINIGQFEKYVNALTRMYMVSLETNQNITETVRTEFDALLKSKDIAIQDLQEQLSSVKQSKENALKESKSCLQENAKLKKLLDSNEADYHDKIANLQSMLTDKDNLNKALTNSYKEEKQKNNSLQEKIDSFSQKNNELLRMKAELSSLYTKQEQLLQDKEHLEKKMQDIKASYEQTIANLKQQEAFVLEQYEKQSRLELDQAVLTIERKYQDQIQTLKEQKQSEIDSYQQKYFSLLEKFQAKETMPED